MSASPYEKVQDLPTPEKYAEAFSFIDEYFEYFDGVAVSLGFSALRSEGSFEDSLVRSKVLATGTLFNDESTAPDDKRRPVAYYNGLVATEEVAKLLFSGPQNLIRYQRTLDKWVAPKSGSESEDEAAERIIKRDKLIQFGNYGLQAMGDDAQRTLMKWAEAVYAPNADKEELSAIFQLGSGAMIASGILRQRGVNTALLTQEVVRADWDGELSTLLRVNE